MITFCWSTRSYVSYLLFTLPCGILWFTNSLAGFGDYHKQWTRIVLRGFSLSLSNSVFSVFGLLCILFSSRYSLHHRQFSSSRYEGYESGLVPISDFDYKIVRIFYFFIWRRFFPARIIFFCYFAFSFTIISFFYFLPRLQFFVFYSAWFFSSVVCEKKMSVKKKISVSTPNNNSFFLLLINTFFNVDFLFVPVSFSTA